MFNNAALSGSKNNMIVGFAVAISIAATVILTLIY